MEHTFTFIDDELNILGYLITQHIYKVEGLLFEAKHSTSPDLVRIDNLTECLSRLDTIDHKLIFSDQKRGDE